MTREEQATVNAIKAMLDQQERHRKELRAQDDEWRTLMMQDIQEIRNDVKRVQHQIAEMPCIMNRKIAACREEREEVTKDAVAYATKRHVMSTVATDWRTWTAALVAIGSVIYGIAT